MIQDIISQRGKEEFYKAVHVIIADREFMPTMLNEFFSKLTGDKNLPIISVFAIGHAMKAISVSMMSLLPVLLRPDAQIRGERGKTR